MQEQCDLLNLEFLKEEEEIESIRTDLLRWIKDIKVTKVCVIKRMKSGYSESNTIYRKFQRRIVK